MRLITVSLLVTFLMALVSGHEVTCYGRDIGAPEQGVKKGIEYLELFEVSLTIIDGTVYHYPTSSTLGPHACEKVYCREKTVITWCNDADTDRMMLTEHIREGAEVIANDCMKTTNQGKIAAGVVNHPDKWRVEIRKANVGQWDGCGE